MKKPFLFLFLAFFLLASHGVPAQTSPGPSGSKQKPVSWLEGKWKGTGYQAPTQSDWSIVLDYDKESKSFQISYPSLNCSGRWELVKKKKGYAEFVEVIQEGLENCDNNVKVVVTQIDERFVSVAYFLPEIFDGVVASAVLENVKFRTVPKIKITKKKI